MSNFIEKVRSEEQDNEIGVVIYKIANYPADYTLKGLHDKYKSEEILIPSFQRRFVWTLSQASALIESFLLGLPVPSVFFYKEEESQKLIVIDGQQRLKTIFGYFDNKFPDTNKPFYLKGVDKKWMGKSFNDLSAPDKRRFKDSVLRAIIVEQLDPKDKTSIFHIFKRLNTGGTVLNAQEIRNCIYDGDFNRSLHELNEMKEWREIIALPRADNRMRDVELILRFLALKEEYKKYKSPMKEFLNIFMVKYRNDKDKVQEFKNIFNRTVTEINSKLDRYPFRIKAGVHAAVLDSIMVAFALNLDRIPSNIRERHRQLLEDNEYIECIYKYTTVEEFVKQRIEIAIRKLFG